MGMNMHIRIPINIHKHRPTLIRIHIIMHIHMVRSKNSKSVRSRKSSHRLVHLCRNQMNYIYIYIYIYTCTYSHPQARMLYGADLLRAGWNTSFVPDTATDQAHTLANIRAFKRALDAHPVRAGHCGGK